MPAHLIFGNINDLDPSALKTTLQSAGINRLDTAARYKNGESERVIGASHLPDDFLVDTKILAGGAGSLTPEKIDASLSNSLTALGVEKVNVLYCHSPDFETPVEVQARAFDEQYQKGRFTHLGVSNFTPSLLSAWLAVSDSENLIRPSYYQGQYNLLCRSDEKTLFPLLRENKIAFTAYSPLASGFLLGNFTAEGLQGGTRYAAPSPYLGWYDRPVMHEAVRRFKAIAAEVGLGMDELALRWVVYHSILKEDDAVILGASRIEQVERNVAQIQKGPLEQPVAERLNALWDPVENEGGGGWLEHLLKAVG